MCSRGSSASRRPDSVIALPRSMRFTVPVTSSSPRDRKSFRICSRSASRMRCRITCFAVCAPMRPNSTFGSRSSMTSSTLASALPLSCASSTESICARFHSGVSSGRTFQRRKVSYAPVFLSICTRTSMSSVYFFLVAEASAISSALNTMSRGTFFSRARTSTSITNSRLPATTGLLAATLNPSQFRHQPRPLDILEREPHRRLQLDELVPHAGHYRLHNRFQDCHKFARALKQKMGRSPSFPAASKLLKFNRISCREQLLNTFRRELAPLAGLEIARQLHRSIAHPQELACSRDH